MWTGALIGSVRDGGNNGPCFVTVRPPVWPVALGSVRDGRCGSPVFRDGAPADVDRGVGRIDPGSAGVDAPCFVTVWWPVALVGSVQEGVHEHRRPALVDDPL
jgi:hypothetical protein